MNSRSVKETKQEKRTIKKEEIQENIKEFKHEPGKEFEGIFRYLSSESNGSIHNNGTIEITTNSIYENNNDYHQKNLVDYQHNDVYYSNNDSNATIYFDFKDNKIQMTNYSIKSYDSRSNYGHLRNWVIEGSNDKNSWE